MAKGLTVVLCLPSIRLPGRACPPPRLSASPAASSASASSRVRAQRQARTAPCLQGLATADVAIDSAPARVMQAHAPTPPCTNPTHPVARCRSRCQLEVLRQDLCLVGGHPVHRWPGRRGHFRAGEGAAPGRVPAWCRGMWRTWRACAAALLHSELALHGLISSASPHAAPGRAPRRAYTPPPRLTATP